MPIKDIAVRSILVSSLLLGLAVLAERVEARELPVERLFDDGLETFAPDTLRLSRLELRDPHLFTQVIVCADVTAAFNDQIEASINAEQILIPPDVPLIGGQPLSALLPGGAGNCAAGDDRDVRDGGPGWWFYFSIEAERQAEVANG